MKLLDLLYFSIHVLNLTIAMRTLILLSVLLLTQQLWAQVTIKKQNESCAGRKDGQIEVMVEGIDGPFDYTWQNVTLNKPVGGNTKILSGLEPAVYSVTVTLRGVGCMDTKVTRIWPGKEVTLDLGARLLDVSPDPLGCGERPVFTYKLYALPHGGTPPYYCSWGSGGLGDLAPGQTNDECTLIVSGSFINQSVSVIDSNGCVDSEGFKKTGAIRICPRDPNDITGPEGYDSMRWVSDAGEEAGETAARIIWDSVSEAMAEAKRCLNWAMPWPFGLLGAPPK